MKNLQHTLKLAMIACILVFASCSKDDSPSEDSTVIEEPTNHELLISGKWYIQSISGPGAGSYNECRRQSYLDFIDEDTVVIQHFVEDAAMQCIGADIRVLDYQMDGDDAFLLLEDPLFPFFIEFISETQLILRQTDGAINFTISLSK